MTPMQWADRNADEFRAAFRFINATNDDFIRTTEERHKSKVVAYIREFRSAATYIWATTRGGGIRRRRST